MLRRFVTLPFVPRPAREGERLRALKLYQVFDRGADQALQDLTRLASIICEAPIALITIIDDDRQWYRTRVGIEGESTPRDQAFCAHTILGDDLLVVEDAREDARFAENPSVTGDPHIRFYAGAPLTVKEGVSLGSLCVIDREPRTLTDTQRDALDVLRRAVLTQLELRRTLWALEAVEQVLPMCAWCRSIRGEDGRWRPVEDYLARAVPVSHGMCPACVEQSGVGA